MPDVPVETKEEILAALADAGFPLNPTQLARLHRARAIRLVATPGLGQGRGRESLYASGTTEQAIRLAALASRERRIPERAWLAWWLHGGPMSGAAVEFLRARAQDLDEMLGKLRALARGEMVEIEGTTWTLDEVYRASEERRLDGPLGKARARTGKKRFSSVMAFLLQLATGEFEGFPIDVLTGSSEPERQLIETAFGLTRARTDALTGVQPWLQGDLEDDLRRFAIDLQILSFETAAEAHDSLLNIARLEVRALVEVVSTAADAFDSIFGRGAFSYREMADTLDLDDYDAQVFAVLAWSMLRRDRIVRDGMAEIISTRGQVRVFRQSLLMLSALRDSIPGFAELLAPERLALVLCDGAAAADFETQLAALREANVDQVAAVLAATDSARVDVIA